MNKDIKPWALVAINASALFYLSSQPVEQSREISGQVTDIVMESIEQVSPNYREELNYRHVHRQVRKSAHYGLYLMLGYLVSHALRKSGHENVSHALLTCVVIAMLDESLQNFVPGRGAQISDVFIDSLGSASGITLNRFIDKEEKSKILIK